MLADRATRKFRRVAGTNFYKMLRSKFDEHPVESNCVEIVEESLRPPSRVDRFRWRLVWNFAQEFFESAEACQPRGKFSSA
jgi:hypothetical protein